MVGRTTALLGLLLTGPAWALPEGTPQLGLTQGLEDVTLVRVEVREGESLKLCSSDDGRQEAPVDGAAIDREPGAPNPVLPARVGAEVLAYPPDTVRCGGDAECADGLRCYFQRTGEAYAAAERSGLCARAVAITPGEGYCVAGAPPRFVTLTGAPGVCTLGTVGEAETLSRSGASTRFFLVDVVGPGGVSVPGGRLFARQWLLNAHSFSLGSHGVFHVVVPVGDAGQVFTLRLTDMRGFRYALVANNDGLSGFRDQSWCQFGDPDAAGVCPFYDGGEVRRAPTRFPLYLHPPEPPPPAPP
ncbi:MAG: hypothetical protein KC549_08270, partial [Myxococcales bacterium]|nr:hypothetical protein [Myxococcales bacterium]